MFFKKKIYYDTGELLYVGGAIKNARGQLSPKGKGTYYHKNQKVMLDGTFDSIGNAVGYGEKFDEFGTPVYKGQFENGLFHGKGTLFYENGDIYYEGDFSKGQISGNGIIYAVDGTKIYDGHLASGKKEGHGKWYTDQGWLYYEGNFKDDLPHGQGHEFNEDGSLAFSGTFILGQRSQENKRRAGRRKKPVEQEVLDQKNSLEEAMAELDSLIGMTDVKEEVKKLADFVKVNQERRSRGLSVTKPTYHMIFTGNPGTGKTTIARIIGKIFAALGVLSKGHFIETDRAKLIGQYIGDTEKNVDAVIEQAKGGVLFIDEAYALTDTEAAGDFGKNAIDTMLKRMEDYREDLVIVAAGYPDKMEQFKASNPGLRSRFARTIHFKDYTPGELVQLICKFARDGQYIFENGFQRELLKVLRGKFKNPEFMATFSNGRYIRNVFEQLVMAQSQRLSKLDLEQLNQTDMITIKIEDLRTIIANGLFDAVS